MAGLCRDTFRLRGCRLTIAFASFQEIHKKSGNIYREERQRESTEKVHNSIHRATSDIGGMITTAVSGMVWQYCSSVLQKEDGGGGV